MSLSLGLGALDHDLSSSSLCPSVIRFWFSSPPHSPSVWVSPVWQDPFSGEEGSSGVSSASLSTVELKGSRRDTNLNATVSLSDLSYCLLLVDLGLIGSGPHSRLDLLCFLTSAMSLWLKVWWWGHLTRSQAWTKLELCNAACSVTTESPWPESWGKMGQDPQPSHCVLTYTWAQKMGLLKAFIPKPGAISCGNVMVTTLAT